MHLHETICILDRMRQGDYNIEIKYTEESTMIYFHNDYNEGCHSKILDKLIATNLEQTTGYGEDQYCAHAAD